MVARRSASPRRAVTVRGLLVLAVGSLLAVAWAAGVDSGQEDPVLTPPRKPPAPRPAARSAVEPAGSADQREELPTEGPAGHLDDNTGQVPLESQDASMTAAALSLGAAAAAALGAEQHDGLATSAPTALEHEAEPEHVEDPTGGSPDTLRAHSRMGRGGNSSSPEWARSPESRLGNATAATRQAAAGVLDLTSTCQHCAYDAYRYLSGQSITQACWGCGCSDGSSMCGCSSCPYIVPDASFFCSAGEYHTIGTTSCTPCPANSDSGLAATSCECNAGYTATATSPLVCELNSFKLMYKGDANGGFVDNHVGFDGHGDAYLSTNTGSYLGPVQFHYDPTNLILWTDAANVNCLSAGGGIWLKRYSGGDCDTNDDSGHRRWQFLSDGRVSTSSGLCLTQNNLGNSRLVTKSCSTVSDEWYGQCNVAGYKFSPAAGCIAPFECQQAGEVPDYFTASCQPCPAGA